MICQTDNCKEDAFYAVQNKIHNLTQIFNFKYLCQVCYKQEKEAK